ncbi:MAG: glycosyltransferase family 2 protein [Armatimonadota bacterium]
MTTTLIVVSYNKRPYTELCLRGQLQCTPPPDQIIVIDNGSTDGSVEMLQALQQQARAQGLAFEIIQNESNAGACTARNQGLDIATGDFIAFMDNDVCVRHRSWLPGLTAALQADERNGIVGPKLVYPFEPYNIECAGVAISPSGRVQYRGRGQAIDTPAFAQPAEVQCLISACWLMKREVVEQIGNLDEVFNPAQFEDFDFCYRAREAGWRVLYESAVEMYHFENVTTDGSPDVKFKYVTMKNWSVFKQRWRYMFAREAGPADIECQWAPLETRPLEKTGIPPAF